MRNKERMMLENGPVTGIRIEDQVGRGDALIEDIGVDSRRYQVLISIDDQNRLFDRRQLRVISGCHSPSDPRLCLRLCRRLGGRGLGVHLVVVNSLHKVQPRLPPSGVAVKNNSAFKGTLVSALLFMLSEMTLGRSLNPFSTLRSGAN